MEVLDNDERLAKRAVEIKEHRANARVRTVVGVAVGSVALAMWGVFYSDHDKVPKDRGLEVIEAMAGGALTMFTIGGFSLAAGSRRRAEALERMQFDDRQNILLFNGIDTAATMISEAIKDAARPPVMPPEEVAVIPPVPPLPQPGADGAQNEGL